MYLYSTESICRMSYLPPVCTRSLESTFRARYIRIQNLSWPRLVLSSTAIVHHIPLVLKQRWEPYCPCPIAPFPPALLAPPHSLSDNSLPSHPSHPTHPLKESHSPFSFHRLILLPIPALSRNPKKGPTTGVHNLPILRQPSACHLVT